MVMMRLDERITFEDCLPSFCGHLKEFFGAVGRHRRATSRISVTHHYAFMTHFQFVGQTYGNCDVGDKSINE